MYLPRIGPELLELKSDVLSEKWEAGGKKAATSLNGVDAPREIKGAVFARERS